MPSYIIDAFNFYKRYRWRAEDFSTFQINMFNQVRAPFEGLFNGAIMSGFEVTPTSGLSVSVTEGIATMSDGYLLSNYSPTTLTFDPVTSGSRRDLIAMIPKFTDGYYVQDPNNPLNTVPLRTNQGMDLIIIKGSESSAPEYGFSVGIIVVCGVRLQQGQTTITTNDIDFEVRDIIGKNSLFQKNQAKYDDRCRVSKETNNSIRIKPSQTQIGTAPKTFLYMNKSTPSRFPLDATSKFNYADTFISFQTGAVTGGDAFTPDFTPTIPTAGNWIVATVSLKTDDSLNVSYGTEGTRAQCLAAIENATTSGAGSIALPSQMMRLAFVLLRSADGISITELDSIDARSTFYFGGPDSPKSYPNVYVSALGNGDCTTLGAAIALLPVAGGVIVVMDSVTQSSNVTLPANTKLIGRGKNATVTFSGGTGLITSKNCAIEDIILAATGSSTICNLIGDYNVISKCRFELPASNASAIGISVNSDGNHIGECVFTGVVSPSLASAIKFNLGSSENTESNNVFTV